MNLLRNGVFRCGLALLPVFIINLFTNMVFINGGFEETSLIKKLLKDYYKLARPVKKITDKVTLEVGMELRQLINVDEKGQTLTTNIELRLVWNDSRFNWNPKDYANITEVRIPPNLIWIPDLVLFNAASQESRGFVEARKEINVLVFNNNMVLWIPPMILKSTCKMDVTWFPFDRQKCTFKFGSWTFSSKYFDLQLYQNNGTVGLSEYMEHGAWKIISTGGIRGEKVYHCCSESYLDILFTIELQRRPSYYFSNLLVPCGLIGFLALLGFTLPPDSGEKLALGVTVLFSLIVFLNMIAETMPANSDSVPLIGKYFNCVMFMIALSVVSTIVVNKNKRSMKSKNITGLARKIFFCWLPWILRMNPLELENNSETKYEYNPEKCQHVNNLETKSTPNADKALRDQWKFAALVVDRLCLTISVIFIFVSIVVFLIYA